MTLDEIKEGKSFILDGKKYIATNKAQGYKILCLSISDNETYALERDTEVNTVEGV